jgi:hypothetical protein
MASALCWLIPNQILNGPTAQASIPVPVASFSDDDGSVSLRDNRVINKDLISFAKSTWHPVMDLLGISRGLNFSKFGQMQLEYEWQLGLPGHGTWTEGTWGNTPIMIEVLQSRDLTAETELLWNGMGDIPNAEFVDFYENGFGVSHTAVVLHNLNTGRHLGMMLEQWWFESDAGDNLTTFPLAIPIQVVPYPENEDIIGPNKLFTSYAKYVDFILTEEGEQRLIEDYMNSAGELCAVIPCADEHYVTWCPLEQIFNEDGTYRTDTCLGVAMRQYKICMNACKDNFLQCLGLGAFTGLSLTAILLKLLGQSNVARLCFALGPGSPQFWACIAGIIIWIGGTILHCWDKWNNCKAGCKLALDIAMSHSMADACAGNPPCTQ